MKKYSKFISLVTISALVGFGGGLWLCAVNSDTERLMTSFQYLKLAEEERVERQSVVGALSNLNKAAALNPDEPLFYIDIGVLSEKLGDDKYAIRCYKLVIDSEKYPEGKEKRRLREKIALLESKLESPD